MTTVGYGTFVPETSGGRVFTVVFGTIGIVVIISHIMIS